MKGRRTLDSIADQTSEMWENGSTSSQIAALIALARMLHIGATYMTSSSLAMASFHNLDMK